MKLTLLSFETSGEFTNCEPTMAALTWLRLCFTAARTSTSLSSPMGGTDNRSTSFTIPVISGINPTSGRVGDAVTILGNHLGQATTLIYSLNLKFKRCIIFPQITSPGF